MQENVNLSDIKTREEKARMLTVLSGIAAVYSFIGALIVFISGTIYSWTGFDTYSITVLPYIIALLFALASVFYGILSGKAAQEEEEKSLLEKRKQTNALNIEEDVRFTAGRTFSNYRRYAPQVVALLGLVIIAVTLYFTWKYWTTRPVAPQPTNILHSAFVCIIFLCLNMFAGIFCTGQSYDKGFRFLRPTGAWLTAGAASMALALTAALLQQYGITGWDAVLRNILFWAYAALAVELLLSFISEFYRPRTSKEERPVFESRILALFTEPGGVIRNVADMLDYQFGFKVSKTWIYSFAEKSIFPLTLLWLLSLWLFTGLSEVGPGENGLRERFGSLVSKTALEPGVYLKMPWPFEKIRRYRIEEVRSITLGAELKSGSTPEAKPSTILWTVNHYAKETNYLVASDKKGEGSKDNAISIIEVSMPVHYRIKKDALLDYAYNFQDPAKTLKDIGEKAATNYFAQADLQKLMSSGRQEAADSLKNLIQNYADSLKLGVEILYVNLHDAHPPIELVAPAFQDVIGAMEQKEAEILKAKAYKTNTIPEAEAQGERIVADAESYKYNTKMVAEAESMRFKRQLDAYKVQPGIFRLRTYLDFLESDCKNVRKYIISGSMPYQIYELNMEEKPRLDLIDANLGELSAK